MTGWCYSIFDGEDIRNYILLDVNESYERLTKMKSKDILGRTVCQCLPSLEKEIIEKLNLVVKTGQSQNY
ncbi:MAG: hypothetical protein ACI8WT_001123 [Clostridium sp.]